MSIDLVLFVPVTFAGTTGTGFKLFEFHASPPVIKPRAKLMNRFGSLLSVHSIHLVKDY